MSFDVEHSVVYKLANAPVLTYPYPHMWVPDIFPVEYYSEMRRHLPPLSSYKPLGETGTVSGNAYKERYITSIEDLGKIPGGETVYNFWHGLETWMLSERFLQLLFQRFAPYAQHRFSGKGDLRFRTNLRLVRDFTSYKIGPHTDTPAKVFSLLFYLPKDTSMSHLGTSIYMPNDPAFQCLGGPHHPFEGFKKIFTAPYVPNGVFLFFKTPHSFHGVDPIEDQAIERDVLLYNAYVDPVPELAGHPQPAFNHHTET